MPHPEEPAMREIHYTAQSYNQYGPNGNVVEQSTEN